MGKLSNVFLNLSTKELSTLDEIISKNNMYNKYFKSSLVDDIAVFESLVEKGLIKKFKKGYRIEHFIWGKILRVKNHRKDDRIHDLLSKLDVFTSERNDMFRQINQLIGVIETLKSDPDSGRGYSKARDINPRYQQVQGGLPR